MNTKESRLRRARQTRARISAQKVARLVVHRTNSHIYAQIVAAGGLKVLTSASTLEADLKKEIKNGGNKTAATAVGKRIAEKAKALGISTVAFDRSGFKYHGRVAALAEAAREAGLTF
jgi:large subunit ribosomal protein L18